MRIEGNQGVEYLAFVLSFSCPSSSFPSLSIPPFQSQVLCSHPNERSDYEIWGSKAHEKNNSCESHCYTKKDLSPSVICGALRHKQPVWILHGRCQLFSISLWFVANCQIYSVLTSKPPLLQPSTNIVLHVNSIIPRTRHAVLLLQQTGAASVSFKLISMLQPPFLKIVAPATNVNLPSVWFI